MFESNSTPCQEKAKQPRLSRSRITAEVVEFEAAAGQGSSQRQFAQERGVPRSTLQHWLSRKATIDAEPTLGKLSKENRESAAIDRRFCGDHHLLLSLCANVD